MVDIKALLFVVVVCLTGTDAVRCRRCTNALTLDDCTTSVYCASGEECYMDEIRTIQRTIVFNAGCRAKAVCSSGSLSGGVIGKRDNELIRRSGDIVACSRCCDQNVTHGYECNAKMCGIKPSSTNAGMCYFCDSSRSGGQGDVAHPTACGTTTSCQPDEICGAQLFQLGRTQTHRYTCLNRRICTLLTQRAIEDIKRCKDPAEIAAGNCDHLKRAGLQMCSVCCADALCNSGTCYEIIDRLYRSVVPTTTPGSTGTGTVRTTRFG